MITILSEHHIKLGDKPYLIQKIVDVNGSTRYELLEPNKHFSNIMNYVYKSQDIDFGGYRIHLKRFIGFLKVERTLNQKLDKKI